MQPSIFVDPSPSVAINQEEIFGPVVVISGFLEENEVVARANDTPFGLTGAVFTQNLQPGCGWRAPLQVEQCALIAVPCWIIRCHFVVGVIAEWDPSWARRDYWNTHRRRRCL